jgi:hypothetical protein
MLPKIREDIRITRLIIGFNDTGRQLQYLRPVSTTPQLILNSKSVSAKEEPTVGVNARMSQFTAGRLREIYS